MRLVYTMKNLEMDTDWKLRSHFSRLHRVLNDKGSEHCILSQPLPIIHIFIFSICEGKQNNNNKKTRYNPSISLLTSEWIMGLSFHLEVPSAYTKPLTFFNLTTILRLLNV